MSQINLPLVNQIEMHPSVGSGLTILHVIAASVLNLIPNGRVNPLIMDGFQLMAWTIAILCGFITLVGYVKRWANKRFMKIKK